MPRGKDKCARHGLGAWRTCVVSPSLVSGPARRSRSLPSCPHGVARAASWSPAGWQLFSFLGGGGLCARPPLVAACGGVTPCVAWLLPQLPTLGQLPCSSFSRELAGPLLPQRAQRQCRGFIGLPAAGVSSEGITSGTQQMCACVCVHACTCVCMCVRHNRRLSLGPLVDSEEISFPLHPRSFLARRNARANMLAALGLTFSAPRWSRNASSLVAEARANHSKISSQSLGVGGRGGPGRQQCGPPCV